MSRIITFGEIMMRLNPIGYERLIQANELEISYAGGEANVAVSLANFGQDVAFVSKVPDNLLGQSALNELRRYGVDTSLTVKGGNRLGLYFVEKGASQRASKVIYDRTGSSIAEAKEEDFDWNKIFKDTSWFHFTGITPALGGHLPSICLEACKIAKAKGIKISCDLNYRNKLWTREEACKTMSQLMKYVDVCIANEEDAYDVFGIKAANTDINSGRIDREGYISVARQITQHFGCSKVAITLRGSISASTNEWCGMLFDSENAYFAPNYRIQIVDRVGGGDSFGGALIYSLMNDFDMQTSIDFAVAASCLKQTIEHDFNLVSIEEVESLAKGNSSGRVQR